MKILHDLLIVAIPSQLCALLPHFSGDHLNSFRISLIGKLYGRFVALLMLISGFIFSEDVLFSPNEYKLMKHLQGDTEDINRTIETLFCICSYTVIVVSSVLNASKHYRTIRDLCQLDEYLVSHGYVASYSCRYVGTLLVLACSSVVLVAVYYIHFESDISAKRELILIVVYCMQMLYSCLFALYLRVILKCLAQRIEFLNVRLDEFTRQEKQLYTKDDWLELSNLIEIFCKFRYINENMNSITGVGLLFYFGFAFYTVTNQSYLAFSTLTTPIQLRKKYDTIGLSCAWVLAETIIMAVICSSFDCLASEKGAQPITIQPSGNHCPNTFEATCSMDGATATATAPATAPELPTTSSSATATALGDINNTNSNSNNTVDTDNIGWARDKTESTSELRQRATSYSFTGSAIAANETGGSGATPSLTATATSTSTSTPTTTTATATSTSSASGASNENDKDKKHESLYECNICLDPAKDAVVSMCGHLFCWPCLHQWLLTRPNRKLCPVCKAAVDKDKVIPLYCRNSTRQEDPSNKVPPRPAGQRTEPEPAPGFRGFGFGDGFHISFGIGAFPFGFFTSTLNLGELRPAPPNRGTTQYEDEQTLSRLFLYLAFICICWLIFA